MVSGKVGRMLFFRLSENEDLSEAIRKRAEENNVKAGVLILIGALKKVVLGLYKLGEYKNICIEGPLEIASCTGNICLGEKGETMTHVHVVVSNEKGEAFGGHLMKESIVGVTAELVIIEGINISLIRAFDTEKKLNLLKLD